MARVALPAGWASALVRRRGPLLIYQWLWLLLSTFGALVVAAPRILSQPLIYTTTATVSFERARYGGLYPGGQVSAETVAVQNIAVNHPQGCDPFGLVLSIFVSDSMVLTIG